jgi:hypothetical protein
MKTRSPQATIASIVRAWDAAVEANSGGVLKARWRLGQACNRIVRTLPYGQREQKLTMIARAIGKHHPEITLKSIKTSLRRSMQFAVCCQGDATLLAKLNRAGLSWRMVNQQVLAILSHVHKLREQSSRAAGRSADAITAQLDVLLQRVARGSLAGMAVKAEFDRWRLHHPQHFEARHHRAHHRQALAHARQGLEKLANAWHRLADTSVAERNRFRKAHAGMEELLQRAASQDERMG